MMLINTVNILRTLYVPCMHTICNLHEPVKQSGKVSERYSEFRSALHLKVWWQMDDANWLFENVR